MEIQLELDGSDKWDAGELPVTYVDYNMKRIGDSWLMDEELTIESLRGFALGDVFVLEKVSNNNKHTNNEFPTQLNLKRIGKSLNAI